ncbi:MAG: ComF family protein [Clostridia bacterium]|nr:ComF family protein [Clostridia bacterium]
MKNHILLEITYPNKCAACDEIIPEDKFLCDYCAVCIKNTEYKKVCTRCGLQKDNCRCKNREFHFAGIIGAYKNEGIARKAYYSYKMGRRAELADFFAKSCAAAIKEVFADIKFDAVFSVPTAHRSRLKRGFDHSELIAQKIAGILGVNYVRGFLKTRHFRPLQHKSEFAKRLENVRGKYYTDKKIGASNVLLFDDIFTTAATLDECAKELMFAGAGNVYCVSVLSTYLKKKHSGEKKNGN